MARRFYDPSRQFRLVLLREGRIDFPTRAARREALKTAIVAQDEDVALQLLKGDIRADLT